MLRFALDSSQRSVGLLENLFIYLFIYLFIIARVFPKPVCFSPADRQHGPSRGPAGCSVHERSGHGSVRQRRVRTADPLGALLSLDVL